MPKVVYEFLLCCGCCILHLSFSLQVKEQQAWQKAHSASKRLRYALEHAEHLNKDISLHDYELPAVVSGGKLKTYICNSTEGVKVVVRCEGCMPGKQHYRKSTPKALCKRGALQCRFCTVCAAVPAVCNVVMPHAAEQLFMRVLWGFGWDEKFCFQVVPPFWHRCMDFFNHEQGYYVQVDGSCHWTDMHKHTCEEVLGADFEQAQQAVANSATMVRVHEADLSRPYAVANTLAAAQGFVGVVLSPAYATQWVSYQGQMQPYTQALVGCDPSLELSIAPSGVMQVQKR